MAWLESLGGDTGGGGSATPITPSNSSPAQMNNGETYEAQGNGVAIESYSSIGDSDTQVYSGNIYKLTNNGFYVKHLPTIEPSDTPQSVTAGQNYNIRNYNGVLVKSISNITAADWPRGLSGNKNYHTPNSYGYWIDKYDTFNTTLNGKYYPSMCKVFLDSTSAYVYDHRPTLKPTTLWTNPSTSTSSSAEFETQTVTLSQAYTNFDYVGIVSSHSYANTSESDWMTTIYTSAQMTKFGNATTDGVDAVMLAEAYKSGSSARYFIRRVSSSSTTSIWFGSGLRLITGSSGSTAAFNNRIIPRKIVGYKIG